MHTPQIIYIVLISIGLLTSANEHGKPRTPNNFWAQLLASGIGIALLIWGGFFK